MRASCNGKQSIGNVINNHLEYVSGNGCKYMGLGSVLYDTPPNQGKLKVAHLGLDVK